VFTRIRADLTAPVSGNAANDPHRATGHLEKPVAARLLEMIR
jgi:hypothetical protein